MIEVSPIAAALRALALSSYASAELTASKMLADDATILAARSGWHGQGREAQTARDLERRAHDAAARADVALDEARTLLGLADLTTEVDRP